MSDPDEKARAFLVSPFERFTERARKALTLAQEEARNHQHPYLGTEHLLMALVSIKDGVAARVLIDLGVDMDRLRHSVEQTLVSIDRETMHDMGMTPRAKKVIDLAVQEVKMFRHRYIGTEHLLLGLLRQDDGPAARVLRSFGVTLEAARAQVIQTLASMGRDAPPAGPKNNVITCRVEDRDLDAIDALIEAGIRTTRSDAASWLISAGIQANQALFDRVSATVSEIRRLRTEAQELAQQIISGKSEPLSSPEEGQ